MNEHVRRWVSVNATVHHDRGISPCFLRIHCLCPSWAVSAEKHSSTETTAPSTGQLWFHAACHISVQPETICKVCIISRYYHKTILSHARPHGVEKMSEWREVKHYNLKHHRRVQKKKQLKNNKMVIPHFKKTEQECSAGTREWGFVHVCRRVVSEFSSVRQYRQSHPLRDVIKSLGWRDVCGHLQITSIIH